MPEHQPDPDGDDLGPMDYLAVEFPSGRITGDGFGVLLDLVDRGVIRILDLEFVTKAPDGSLGVVDVAGLDTDPGLDLSPFAGRHRGSWTGPISMRSAPRSARAASRRCWSTRSW